MKNSGNGGFMESLWEFFASVRLTVFVLLALAVTSIFGTLIPQNESHELYFRKYGEALYRIFFALDIYDMYHAWWFQLLIILLTANIVVCSVDRLSSLWKIVFVRKPDFKIGLFRNTSARSELVLRRSPDRVADEALSLVQKRFRFAVTEKTDNGFHIFAEKGRKTRLGVYIVHLSVVLLLMGGLIGSMFGFDGFVTIPEGEAVNEIHLRNAGEMKKLDFSIRCEDFDVSFYDTGAPKEFRSRLVISENGRDTVQKEIIVNDPLRYRGVNIFQSSYGTMPTHFQTFEKEGVTLKLESRASHMNFFPRAFPGKPVDLPEGAGTLVLKEMRHSYLFRNQMDVGETLVAEIRRPDGASEEIYLPLRERFAGIDKMRKGSRFVITVQDAPRRFYTGLQVTGDPGVPLVYAGFILMILGCYVTFFMSHQRVMIAVSGSGGKTDVTVSGKSGKNPLGMQLTVRRLSEALAEQDASEWKGTREACNLNHQ